MKFNFKFQKKKRTYNDAFSNGELNKFPIKIFKKKNKNRKRRSFE